MAMRSDTDVEAGTRDDQLRDIPRWARRYAENRTLYTLIHLGIFLAGAGVFCGLGRLGVYAYESENQPLTWISLAAVWVFLGALLWYTFWGARRLVPGLTKWLYRGEGGVSVDGAETGVPPRVPALSVLVLLLLVGCHLLLTQRGLLPLRYAQPISVVYAVPFMLYLGLKLRAQPRSPFMCLWPVLYGLHGVLILAGVPISFGAERATLDIFWTVPAYGFIAALAGHLYSRLALRRLRTLAADTADEAQADRA